MVLGRKTAYSLMSVGFHSVNGLETNKNCYIWSTYIVARMAYGLEVLLLSKSNFEYRDTFQRKMSLAKENTRFTR